MMKQNEQTECAMAVALAVFDFIQLVGDEIVYDVNRASDLNPRIRRPAGTRSVAPTAQCEGCPVAGGGACLMRGPEGERRAPYAPAAWRACAAHQVSEVRMLPSLGAGAGACCAACSRLKRQGERVVRAERACRWSLSLVTPRPAAV